MPLSRSPQIEGAICPILLSRSIQIEDGNISDPSTVQLKMKGDLCLIPRSRSIQNEWGYMLDPPLPFNSK